MDDFDTLVAEIAKIPEHIVKRFIELSHEARRAGFRRFSADAVLHRIRWYERVERGNREFKCNDHWTAPLARWTMLSAPELDGMFEIRKRRSASDEAA